MTEPPNRIREWRVHRRLTLRQLAERAGTSAQQLSRLELGDRRLDTTWLDRLSKALGIKPEDLLKSSLTKVETPLFNVPILRWDNIAQLVSGKIPTLDMTKAETLPIQYERPTLFAFRVEDSSMNRTAPPGAYLIVDYEDRVLVDGKYYVFYVNDMPLFRQYRSSDGPIRLISDTSEAGYETIYPDSPPLTVGRVVRVQTEL